MSALGYQGGAKTSVIYLNNTVSQQKAVAFSKALQVLSTCLGGHALMGPLFSAPLLLVEDVWFTLPKASLVRLELYDVSGRKVAVLFQGMALSGRSRVRWDGVARDGRAVPSGVYFARLSVGTENFSRKFVWVR